MAPIIIGVTSHVHLVFRSAGEQKPELLIGDFKRFTSKAIVKAIIENPKESRKDFLLDQFRKAGISTSNVNHYQFWRHDNHPIELWSNKVIDEMSMISGITNRNEYFDIMRIPCGN